MSFGNGKCDFVPNDPFSIWSCEWSTSNKIKTCRKTCLDNFQLTTGPTQLKCHVRNGWIEKLTAECIPKPAASCDGLKHDFSPETISLNIETCSK